MSWTPEEKDNLIKLLLSVDENNRALALEILKPANNIDDFAEVLYFLDCCIYDLQYNADFNKVFKKISAEIKVELDQNAGLLKSLYSHDKGRLKDLEEMYEKNAASQFDTFFEMAPQHSHVYNALGNRLIGFGMKKKGLEYLKKAVKLDPESYSNNFDYAFNLNESKKNALTIISHYKKCIEIRDNGIGPYHNIGRIYSHQLKDYESALEVMKAGIAKYPYADTMIEIAMAEEHSGNLQMAREFLEKAIETDAFSHLAHNNLAFLLWKYFKEYDTAKVHIDKALQLKPKDGLYWHTLAEVEWYGFKNKEKALEALYKGKEVQKSYKGGDEMIRELEAKS